MRSPAMWHTWPVWSRFLFGALVLYSGLLCGVSISVLVSAIRQHWALKPADIGLQALMVIFLPLLLLGLRNLRLASGLLFIAIGVNLLLLCTWKRTTGDGTAVMLVGSILFLGLPMLGSAIVLARLAKLGRNQAPARLTP